MATQFQNVLSAADLAYLLQLPETLAARARLGSGQTMASFSITVSQAIHERLRDHLGLTVAVGTQIPMRWIRGDTVPHVDIGAGSFENTYLVYCTDSPGQFVLDGTSYPISASTGYVFSEGVSHTTLNTGTEPRLLLGPMNEHALPVGGTFITYYPTEADALAFTNVLGYNSSTFVVGDVTSGTNGGFTSWRIASSSSGPANQALVYTNGQTLSGTAFVDYYYLYPAIPCFLEGTTILCNVNGADAEVPVEQLRPGTLVKTSRDGYKKVVLVGKSELKNPGDTERSENRLYKLTPAKYPELKEDLFITGCHAILVPDITDEQRKKLVEHLGRIFVTDRKYRLIACVDERAEPWASEGTYPIWHFALEHTDEAMNYGVYANGGLLVESCNIRFLKNKSNMTVYS